MTGTETVDHDVEIDVAMAVTRDTETGQYLIIRKHQDYRASDEAESGGRYDRTPWEVPGGKIAAEDFEAYDLGKDDYGHGTYHEAAEGRVVEHAARRELEEETGLDGTVLRTAAPYHVVQEDGDTVKDIYFYPVLLAADIDTPSIRTYMNGLTDPEHDGVETGDVAAIQKRLTQNEMQAFKDLKLE